MSFPILLDLFHDIIHDIIHDIHVTRHITHYHIHPRLILTEFGIGLIELGVGQKIHVSYHFIIMFICG